jgi:Leucine-rich repeat (LRR) protein
MEEYTVDNLSARISNCLQTILDLEPDLERLQMGHVLIKEFKVLKTFLSKVERIEIQEQDVRRIETATENFLRELKSPLAILELERVRKRLVH